MTYAFKNKIKNKISRPLCIAVSSGLYMCICNSRSMLLFLILSNTYLYAFFYMRVLPFISSFMYYNPLWYTPPSHVIFGLENLEKEKWLSRFCWLWTLCGHPMLKMAFCSVTPKSLFYKAFFWRSSVFQKDSSSVQSGVLACFPEF